MKSTRRCGCAMIPLLGLLSNNDRRVDKKTVTLRETQGMTKTTSVQGSSVRFRSARDVPDTSVLNGRAPGVKTIVTAGADDNQNSG